jgi:hypothetical protein
MSGGGDKEDGREQQIKPFSMSRFCTLWRCECEFEVDGNLVYLWEPLHPHVGIGPEAKPRWEYEQIVFYRPEQKDWIYVNRHLMFDKAGFNDVLVLKNGQPVEVVGAQVVWREGRWFIRWHGYKHSRLARAAAAFFEDWRSE